MSTIFISHSSRDNKAAEDLRRRLERDAKHSCVFLDFDPSQGIVAGESWERTLYRKLRACRVVIAICTDAYLASSWCFAEIALARMEGKTVITLFCDGLSPDAKVPSIIEVQQLIDLRSKPEEGFQRLWTALDKLDVLGVQTDWNEAFCPYLGLDPYLEQHAPIYMGRETEIRAGVTLLERGAPGLIMVLGASGSGKSSFVRAGVVPRLRPKDQHWIIVDPFRPGRDPFSPLAMALDQTLTRISGAGSRYAEIKNRLLQWHPDLEVVSGSSAPDENDTTPDNRLLRLMAELEALQRDPPEGGGDRLTSFLNWSLDDLQRITDTASGGDVEAHSNPLLGFAQALRQARGAPDARVLLVIDQFEELLGKDGADPARTAQFFDLLKDALETEDSPLMAYATMRSDFLDAFQQANARHQIDFETMALSPLGVDGLERIITEPARLSAMTLETGLARRIIEDADAPDALPLLSYTLKRLWEACHASGEMTLEAYERLGGVAGSLAREAQVVLDKARKAGKEPALQKAFLEMVRLTAEGQYARQPAIWESDALRPVHAFLAPLKDDKVRLLVPKVEDGVETVEVTHEALFRNWPAMRDWIDTARAELIFRQQLEQASTAWLESAKQADFLWHGTRLAQGVDYLTTRKGVGAEPAIDTMRAFIKAGEAVRKRRVFQRRALVASVGTALSILAGFALWAEHQAKIEQRASWAQQQALLSDAARLSNARESVTLAQKAICVTHQHDGAVMPDAQRALNLAVDRLQNARFLTTEKTPATQLTFLPPMAQAPEQDHLLALTSKGTAMLWAVPNFRAPACQGASEALSFETQSKRMSFAQETRALVFAGGTGSLSLYETADDSPRPLPRATLARTDEVSAFALSPDGSLLADALPSGQVVLTALPPEAPGRVLPGVLSGGVDLIAFAEDSARVAAAGQSGEVVIWDTGSGTRSGQTQAHRAAVTALALDEAWVASGDWSGEIVLWQPETDKQLTIDGHSAAISVLKLLPEIGLLLSASWDGTVRLWDLETGRQRAILEHPAPVTALALVEIPFTQEQAMVLTSATWDGDVQLWQLDIRGSGAPRSQILLRHSAPVNALALSPDKRRLASASDDGHVGLATLPRRPEGYVWRNGMDVMTEAGDNLIAIIRGRQVQVVNTEDGADLGFVSGYDGSASAIAFSTVPPRRLAVEAEGITEFYLDPAPLMSCAAGLLASPTIAPPTEPASTTPPPPEDLSALCEAVDLGDDFRSLFSRATDWLPQTGQ